MSSTTARRRAKKPKTGQGPISDTECVELADLTPAALNDEVYRPVATDDPITVALAEGLSDTIDRFGIMAIDPILVSIDDVIVSGHRRRAALLALGRTRGPVRRLAIRSTDPDFGKYLVLYNDQRDKDPAERVREQLLLADPEDAYRAVQSQRAATAKVKAEPLVLGERRNRSRISKAKRPFLDAVRPALDDLADYLPVSDRKVFYVLLDAPPLRHASKPDSVFRNDKQSYKSLTDLLTRARIEGLIPFESIGDETRPVCTWNPHASITPFVRDEIDGFLGGYWRDLMQGQPNHVEIVGEKMTLESTIKSVLANYTIPYTIGRGYASLPPRKDVFERYRKSGKRKLVILFLADHDPEGMDIAPSFAKSMRDDFGVADIHAVRVGLNPEQVAQLKLPANTSADLKKKGSRYKKYVARFGSAAYELDAVPVPTLQTWLREAIHSVIDVAVFNAQVEREKHEQATLAAYKKAAVEFFGKLRLGQIGPSPDSEKRGGPTS